MAGRPKNTFPMNSYAAELERCGYATEVWRQVDQAVLGDVIKFLGLRYPVHFTVTDGKRKVGVHRFRNGRHEIRVSQYLKARSATKTLLHELQHAAQTERFADGTRSFTLANRLYNKDPQYGKNQAVRYQANPMEKQAREFADAYVDAFRLCHDAPIADEEVHDFLQPIRVRGYEKRAAALDEEIRAGVAHAATLLALVS